MPIYEYECTKCRHIFEDWCKSFENGKEPHACPQCAAMAQRIISHTSFALKGSGWYATEYGTMKNTQEAKPETATTDTPKVDMASTTEPKAAPAAKPSSPVSERAATTGPAATTPQN